MSVAAQLRERLCGHHAAIRSLSGSFLFATQEPAWWSESTRCWWLRGAEYHDKKRSADDAIRLLHAGAEALAFLDVLARMDYHAFMDEWSVLCEYPPRSGDSTRHQAPPAIVVGLEYFVNNLDDLAAMAASILGTHVEPTDSFVDDVKWLKSVTHTVDEVRIRSIPVQLVVSHSVRDPTELCRQILQHVVAQQSQLGVVEDSTTVARFEIAEVLLSHSTNVGALPYLVQLQERGIYVPVLPSIQGDREDSAPARLATARSLCSLIQRQRSQTNRPGVTKVEVSNSVPQHLITPLLSAVQVSDTVKSVELSVSTLSEDPDDDEQDMWGNELSAAQRNAVPSLLQWIAYALFSRHAQHHVENVHVSDRFLTDTTVRAIRRELRAHNPLALMFPDATVNAGWITSSRFLIGHPDEAWTKMNDAAIFDAPGPLTVRAISAINRGGLFWWKVLLPGCGEAWVRDNVGVPPVLDANESQHPAPIYFSFEHLAPRNSGAAWSLVRLLSHIVRGVDVEEFASTEDDYDYSEENYDMADWASEIFRTCPHVERLAFPERTTIGDFQPFVDHAIVGNVRLRELSLQGWVDGDAVVNLLDALSDVTHPLSSHLEKLHLHVTIPWEPTRDFRASWERMLQQNDKLQTISLVYSAREDMLRGGERVVALRTGPLGIRSKLAFLSVLQDPTCGTGMRCLDASVMGAIFQFAAESHTRKIDVAHRDY